MERPSLVRRLAVPIFILLAATLYLMFSTNVADWVRSHQGSPIADVLVTH